MVMALILALCHAWVLRLLDRLVVIKMAPCVVALKNVLQT
jgi:hypothetical protein